MNISTVTHTENSSIQKVKQFTPTKNTNFQNIWKKIFIGTSIISFILATKIYSFQTNPLFDQIRKGKASQLFGYAIVFGIFYVSFQNLLHYLLDDYFERNILNYERFKTKEARKKRSYTLAKWVYQVCFYLISTPAAYLILKQTSIMPTWLGGSGQCTNLSRYINNFDEGNNIMSIFTYTQFGKHLGRFFYHTFIRPEGSFYEYVLHHALSSSLIFYSYMLNFWLHGIFVLLIHDSSQIFMKLGRGIRDTKYKNTIYRTIIDTLGAFLWIFCRIFLLSFCTINACIFGIVAVLKNPELYRKQNLQVMFLPGLFMTLMLVALEIMQIFWTTFMVKQYIRSNFTIKIGKQSYD